MTSPDVAGPHCSWSGHDRRIGGNRAAPRLIESALAASIDRRGGCLKFFLQGKRQMLGNLPCEPAVCLMEPRSDPRR